MKKVKKYIIASFLLVASSLVFFGCASKNESKIELKDWGNTTDTAEFGEEYQLREYVYDKNGNAYNVDATVMLGKDEIKIVDNFFTVENFGTYTINYSTNAVSQIVTTTLTVQERVDTDFLISAESDGIKLQLLHVLEGTDLACDWQKGLFQTLSLEEYADILCDCVEVLSPEVVVHRLTGDAPKKFLLSPMWSADKKRVLNEINRSFELRDVVQGKNFTKKTQCP